MKIYTLGEILKTEHLGDEKYVRVEELKELVEEAFHEGWGARSYSYEDGMSSDDWAISETKIKLEAIGG